jgi:hypothetical protein
VPNKRYLSGRRFEYARAKAWRDTGYAVTRAAGSHGFYDLYCAKAYAPMVCIQCKRVRTVKQAERLIAKFIANPPFPPGAVSWNQRIEVYITSTKQTLRGWA